MEFEVLAEGLAFPEGPVILDDGSIILVEINAGKITRVHKGKAQTIAVPGGGPNGAALGPDGALYVCNNGGAASDDALTEGRIERVNLATGAVERVLDRAGANRLSGPNDLVFDRQGGLWFTDYGKTGLRLRHQSGIYYAKAGVESAEEISFGGSGYNGIGLAPDEATIYAAETNTGRLIAFDLAGPGRVVKGGRGGRYVGAGPGRARFDSLAVLAGGDICIAAIELGVATLTPAGACALTAMPDKIVTNICFGGSDMRDAYITFSGAGALVRTRWPAPGLKLNFQSYA